MIEERERDFLVNIFFGHALIGRVWSEEILDRRRRANRESMKNPEIKRKRIVQALTAGFVPFLTREWHYQPRTKEYREFRAMAWERDGNKCTKCGSIENLCIHHLISRTERPDLRFDIDNVITLCRKCHAKEEARLKHERNRREKSMDYAAFCPYVNRPDLLARVVSSTAEAGVKLHIINNSDDKNLEAHPALIINPPVPLSFTQSMNFEFLLTKEFGKKYCVHMHSDAVVPPEAFAQLLEYARRMDIEGRRWMILYTLYDVLCCYNVDAVLEVGGYDTNFAAYFSDNDLWQRAKVAGFECINTDIQGISHEGSATINSDPKLQFLNGQTFPLYSYYYQQKWGGEPGHEKFTVPFDNPDLLGGK